MGDNRPTCYFDDDIDRWVYRASAFGRCTTALIYARAGLDAEPWPEWFQQRLDEGTEYEDPILEKYQDEYEVEVDEGQKLVELEVGDGLMIRGHIDGVEQSKEGDHEDELVIDAKKFRAVLWEKVIKCSTPEEVAATFPEYAWQLSCYMAGLKLERARLVIGYMEIDEDKEPVGITDLHVVTFEKPPFSRRQIVARLKKIEKLAAEYEETQEAPACDKSDYPCPFYYMHEEKEVVPAPEEVVDELEQAVTTYRNGMEYEKKGKELKDSARPVIAKLFDKVDEEEVATESWIVKDTVRQGNQYFDINAAVQDGAVSEKVKKKYMKRGKDSRYPTIKARE